MNKYIYRFYLIIFFLVSCDKEDKNTKVPALRTLIVYMAADNDLWNVALVDIEEMKQGYKETGVNLIVLMEMANDVPCLIKITENEEQKIKTYRKFNIDKHIFFVKITN